MSIESRLKKLGELYTKTIQDEIDDRGINASYQLRQSAEFRTTKNTLLVLINAYGVVVNNGRKPGKMPPISEIKRYIDNKEKAQVIVKAMAASKGITTIQARDQYAFLKARAIGKKGTRPNPFLDATLKKINESAILKEIEEEALLEVNFIIDNANI